MYQKIPQMQGFLLRTKDNSVQLCIIISHSSATLRQG